MEVEEEREEAVELLEAPPEAEVEALAVVEVARKVSPESIP